MVSESLIRRLARHRDVVRPLPPIVYDEERGISLVLSNGEWLPSYESAETLMSKKADIETGEDQKSV